MSNRKQRRAAAHQSAHNADSIPLSQPSRSPPKGKTLVELASERDLLPASASSTTETETVTVNKDGTLTSSTRRREKTAAGVVDWPEISLYTISFTLLHTTLQLLLLSQYSPDPPTLSTLPSLLKSHLLLSPHPYIVFILVRLLHPRADAIATQALFAAMSVVAGAFLVKTTNEGGYLAEMKRSPALGTIWVYSVVELRVAWAAGSVGTVMAWAWSQGYKFW